MFKGQSVNVTYLSYLDSGSLYTHSTDQNWRGMVNWTDLRTKCVNRVWSITATIPVQCCLMEGRWNLNIAPLQVRSRSSYCKGRWTSRSYSMLLYKQWPLLSDMLYQNITVLLLFNKILYHSCILYRIWCGILTYMHTLVSGYSVANKLSPWLFLIHHELT